MKFNKKTTNEGVATKSSPGHLDSLKSVLELESDWFEAEDDPIDAAADSLKAQTAGVLRWTPLEPMAGAILLAARPRHIAIGRDGQLFTACLERLEGATSLAARHNLRRPGRRRHLHTLGVLVRASWEPSASTILLAMPL